MDGKEYASTKRRMETCTIVRYERSDADMSTSGNTRTTQAPACHLTLKRARLAQDEPMLPTKIFEAN